MKIADEKLFNSIRNFLLVYIPKQCQRSPNTVKSYRTALNQFMGYVAETKKIKLHQVTFEHFNKEDVSKYLDWLQETRNCSSATRNQRLMALRSFASYCTEYDIANIALQIDIYKVPFQKVVAKTIKYLSEDAIKSIMKMPVTSNYKGLRNSFFMILMYDTAARCQEMLDIKVKDIVLEGNSPYLYLTGKGAKTRPVPLMQKTVEHLNKYIEWFHPEDFRNPNDYLFYTVIHNQKHQMSPDTVANFVRNYGEAARKDNPSVPENVHPHQFRHTRAIHWYRSGIPLPLISDYLGHAKLQTTLIYAYADTEMKRNALEKANALGTEISTSVPKWKNDETTIKKLYGLE